jgi:hypothetical protein
LEIRSADVRAGGAVAFPCRFLRALTQTAIGHHILPPGKAHKIMPRIQEDQSQDVANPGNSWPPGQRLGIGWLCRVDAGSLQVVEDLVVVTNEPQVYRKALWHGGIRTPLGDASAVRLIRQFLPNLGQSVLAVGMLEMREPRGPFARERPAAPQEVAGRPPRGGRDRGVGEQATAEQHGDFLRVNPVILGLPAVKGFPRQRVSEHTRNSLVGTQVGQPVPREETCDTNAHVFPVGRDGREKGGWAG